MVLNAKASRPFDAKSVARQGWFGLAPDELAALASERTINMSLTGLELKGISRASDQQYDGAYIAEKGQPEHFYRIGDALPANAGTLAEILADSVSVRQASGLAILRFPDSITAAATPAAEASSSPFFALPPDKPPAPREELTAAQVAKRFVTDPASMLGRAGLQPIAPGETKGYKFTGDDPQGVFQNSPVQKDDVILAVDGNAVGDAKADRMLVPKLAMSQTLKLDIQRGDQRLTVDYAVP